MRSKFKGQYPKNWNEIAEFIKAKAGYKCERCGHVDARDSGYMLTVHHLDNNKANCEEWNLAALCQRCHLYIQGRVFLPQFYLFEHSDWIKPHLEGYYRSGRSVG